MPTLAEVNEARVAAARAEHGLLSAKDAFAVAKALYNQAMAGCAEAQAAASRLEDEYEHAQREERKASAKIEREFDHDPDRAATVGEIIGAGTNLQPSPEATDQGIPAVSSPPPGRNVVGDSEVPASQAEKRSTATPAKKATAKKAAKKS